jgi:ABC-type multidrug transport system ATPase subunit
MLESVAAKTGITILITIHQPRIEVWELFSNVMIVSKGSLVFYGTAARATSHFAALSELVEGSGLAPTQFDDAAMNSADALIDFLNVPQVQRVAAIAYKTHPISVAGKVHLEDFAFKTNAAFNPNNESYKAMKKVTNFSWRRAAWIHQRYMAVLVRPQPGCMSQLRHCCQSQSPVFFGGALFCFALA